MLGLRQQTHTRKSEWCVYYIHPLLCILSAHWRVSPFRCPKLIPPAKWKTREKNWSAGTNCPYFQSTNSTLDRQRGDILKYTKDFNPGDLEAEERQTGKSHWKPQGGRKGGHVLFSSKTHNLPRHWRVKILSPQGLKVHRGRTNNRSGQQQQSPLHYREHGLCEVNVWVQIPTRLCDWTRTSQSLFQWPHLQNEPL